MLQPSRKLDARPWVYQEDTKVMPVNQPPIDRNAVGKSKSKHEYMLDCLRFELEFRRKNNSMGFMKRMSKWFMSEEWLMYEEFLKEQEIPKEIIHQNGTDIE